MSGGPLEPIMRLRTCAPLATLAFLLAACAKEEPPAPAPSATTAAVATERVAEPEAAPPSALPADVAAEAHEPEAPAAETPSPAAADVAEVSSARAAPRTPSAPPADPGAEEEAEADDDAPQYTAEQLEEAARHALGAASRVGAGSNDCETAYARLAALMHTLEREAPGTVQPLPAEDRFLAVCSSLPAEMQRCLVVEYAIEHEAECRRLHEALSPEVRARLDALMSGG
jgi:hypothetical protein